MQTILEFFAKYWIKFLVCFIVGLLLMTIYNFTSGNWAYLMSYIDGGFVAGAALFFVGMLSLVNSFGAFDLSSFYFRRKRVDENHKEDFYEYVTRRGEERKKTRIGFLPYVIVGIAFILFSVIALLASR